MATILVIDDERNLRRAIAAALGEQHELVEVGTSPEALARARETRPDAVLLDLRLGDEDGISLIPELRKLDADLPIVVLTAHGTVESCVRAMKAGAADYLLKPFDLDELSVVLERVLSVRRLASEVRRLRESSRPSGSGPGLGAILGESPPVRALRELVGRLAPCPSAVLVTGPSGTGKELVARALHEESDRRDGPFVVVNCAAIPESLLESELFGHDQGAFTGATARRRGSFELAQGGTLFLDEIGELPLKLQPKLLRVLQDGTFTRLGGERALRSDARVVSATNRDLSAEVAAGRFREDLLYRLNTFTVEVPSLASRRTDILPLLETFMARTARRLGRDTPKVMPDLADLLEAQPWPGNVRQLEHVAERLVVLADNGTARIEDLPPVATPSPRRQGETTLAASLEAHEAEVIRAALLREGGHRARTARALGISLRSLQYKLARYRID